MDNKNRLRYLRKQRGISAKTMADALGLQTVGAYYKKETGRNKITIEEAKVIASIVGSTIEEVFGDIA